MCMQDRACSSVDSMASYSESESVFTARVKASGLSDGDAAALISEVKNLKQLAFISSYAPGQSDEKPLMDVLENVLKRPQELATKACFRALWHEAYAVSTLKNEAASGADRGQLCTEAESARKSRAFRASEEEDFFLDD